ncbi:MAG: hypothetical protein OEW04_04945 [Nitrospirota bacterium]|nr:hypothetical protein [Nitrospirota bacterium]
MITLRIFSVIAVVFGLLTLKEGGSVIFNMGSARQAAGNFVPYVVWFNFLSGFFYIAAGTGLWMQKRWAVSMSIILLFSIAITYIFLGIHILNAGPYEMRTVYAMALRTFLWGMISIVSYKQLRLQPG